MIVMTSEAIFPCQEFAEFQPAPSCPGAVLTTRSATTKISSENTTKKFFIRLFREGNREKSAAVTISRLALIYPCFPRGTDVRPSGGAVSNPDRNGRAKERRDG
jgi:hypothetical protein